MATKYLSFLDPSSSPTLMSAKARIPSLSSIPTLLPHKLRRKWRATKSKIRSRQSPTSSIASLNTSFSPADTLRSLRAHRWSYWDAQYIFLTVVVIFALSVIDYPGPLVKTSIATLFLVSLTLPITRQFFLPAMPLAVWGTLFYSCKFISAEFRPAVWVRVLPALENIFYGANLSNILSAHKHVVLDVLAWIPYGVTHYGSPIFCSLLIFFMAPPGSLPAFARALGYMNIIAVLTQIVFPCSAPWYENKYGLAPATYSVIGDPAGLARIDKLFGIDLYTSAFNASPLVFGAFPSLHAGWATLDALFMSHCFPKLTPIWITYALWLWWATMYLQHHYLVDLVAGGLIAAICFFIAKSSVLPRIQPGKLFRWDYDYVEMGEKPIGDYAMLAGDEDFRPLSDSDEWTIGSSSSYSSGQRSPSHGTSSPTDASRLSWEGDTLASHSDHEQV